MAVERHDDGTHTITGSDIPVYRVLTIRRAFILKIDTGMNLTRVSPLKAAQHDGITSRSTYRGALKDVNKWLQERGVEPKWSRTYPQG
jgi:hypothetical protein